MKVRIVQIGVRWDVTEATRLRFAAFQAVRPALFANRTIQPTQIAGFNQFYDGINGTTSWNYGAGFDARLTGNLYGGIDLSWRDLDVHAPSSGKESTLDWTEQLYRAYLYWTPGPNWAIRGVVEYDVFDSEKTSPLEFPLTRVKTLSLPLAVRYFSPLGFCSGIGVTFVRQDVNRLEGVPLAGGDDSFVVVDASIGYRFPQRRGLVSLEARNLFNEGFKFQDDNYRTNAVATDQSNVSPFIPERAILGRLTLNF